MKHSQLFLLFFIITLASCSKHKDLVIELSGKNINSDSVRLKTNNLKKLHNQKDTLLTIKIQNDGSFSKKLNIDNGYYLLKSKKYEVPIYLKNGYKLKIESKNDNIIFAGKGKNENEYLAIKRNLEDSISSYNHYSYYSQLTERKFLKALNSIESIRRELIKSNDLENDFSFLESQSVSIDKAHNLINYPFIRKKIAPDYNESKAYPDPLKDLDVNDERLLNIPHFKMFLFLYVINCVTNESENYLVGNSYLSYINSKSFIVTNKNIKEEILYKTAKNTISNSDNLEAFYNTYINTSSNRRYQNEITEKYLDLIKLDKGNSLPSLELTELDGTVINLNNLQDFILYIDIWANWCKPCLEEIPSLFHLQEKFKGKKIKFITIAIESEKSKIAKLIKANDLKSINIFDKKNEKRIKDVFQVSSLPRYLLINKKGVIYDLSAKKPSDKELVSQIQSLL